MSCSSSSTTRNSISDVIRLDLTDMDLVSRDDEIKTLRDALERITDDECCSSNAHKAELALVAGLSGTGKSSLVRVALQHHTQQKGGFFIQGKFDQFSSTDESDSYSAILEALDQLCKLVASHKDRDRIVQSIQETLGNEAGRLSTFIPGLQDLIGIDVLLGNENDDAGDTEQGTSYARFTTLCGLLLRCIASRERPIVLFVDDLQWSDGDSLKLIRSLLVSERLESLLIVGAYRNDEVGGDHQLFSATLKNIAAAKVMVSRITLSSLDEISVNNLVAFVTELKAEETAPLSQLIHQKTGGNCFFVTQFLEMLQDRRLLRFCFDTYQWGWNLEEIAAKTNISDNVVELVSGRISILDPKSYEIFKIAGCLGSQFTVDILHVISCSRDENADSCTTVYGETKKTVDKLISMHLFEPSRGDWIKFTHDRIQESSAILWEPSDQEAKAKFCLQIGRIVKDHAKSEGAKHEEWLFFTSIDLLNKGSQFVCNAAERVELASLNQTAAQKATERSAFLPAACYNEAAIALLSETSWLDDPDLTMKLYDTTAECYLRCGRSQRTFELAQGIIEHASNTKDRLRGQCIQMEALEHQRCFDEGRELGLEMMKFHGVRFPRKPNACHIIRGFLRTKRLLEKYTDEELLNFPAMTDETELAISKVEYHLVRSLFYARNKDVMPLLWFRGIEKAMTFGFSPYICSALVCFGNLLGHLHDSKRATRFGRLSLLVCKKFGYRHLTPAMDVTYYYMSNHWCNPLQSSIDPLVNGYIVGMEVGDVQMALTCGVAYCATYLNSGLHLDVLEKDLPKFISVIEEYNLHVVLEQAIPTCQLVLLLTGYDKLAIDPFEFSGRVMQEGTFRTELLDNGSTYAVYIMHTMKLRARVFLGSSDKHTFEEYQTIRSKEFSKEIRADFGAKQDDCYGALAAIACFKKLGKRWYLRYARRLAWQMELYVKDGAINCLHILQLLKAEMMTCMKSSKPASQKHYRREIRRAFDDAISSASRSGFCQDAGLANEKAAAYHSTFDTEYANDYLRKAFQHYQDWGAGQKIDQMLERHPFLKRESRAGRASGRMRARGRYEEDGAKQHKTLDLR